VSWFTSRSLLDTRYHGTTITIRHIQMGSVSCLLLVFHIYGCLQLALLTSSESHLRHCLSLCIITTPGFLYIEVRYFRSVFTNIFSSNLFYHYWSSYAGEGIFFGALDTSWLWHLQWAALEKDMVVLVDCCTSPSQLVVLWHCIDVWILQLFFFVLISRL
jgi:hypothetical protein